MIVRLFIALALGFAVYVLATIDRAHADYVPCDTYCGLQSHSREALPKRERRTRHAPHAHRRVRHHSRIAFDANGNRDPRPRAWCGWWLRHQLGVADRSYNLARNWRHYGMPAGGPAPGVIAVWPHHVGIVTGVPSSRTIILKSGNDGHAVRERERSRRRVIAWRWPNSIGLLQ